MSVGPWDIDAIVREVLQRLEQLASQSRRETPPPNPVPSTPRVDRQELRLADHVVTLATVDGRLRGIHRLVVSRTAVITPSVRDLLRRQDIALLRDEPAAAGDDSPVALEIIAAEADYDASRLTARMPAAVWTSAATVPAAVARAAASARDKHRLTVVLTRRTALALCLANRHRVLRAAWAENVEMAREAKSAIGANVLVVDPAALTDDALPRIVGEFLQGAPHECPSELRI